MIDNEDLIVAALSGLCFYLFHQVIPLIEARLNDVIMVGSLMLVAIALSFYSSERRR